MHLPLHALWNDTWGNIVAPSLWTLLGIGAHYLASRRASRREHQETRDHVTRATGGGGGDGGHG